MDDKLNTATQGVFGHWEITPEPLSPSTPPTNTQQQHSHLSSEILWCKKRREERQGKPKEGLVSGTCCRGRMLVSLGMRRAENVTGQKPGRNCPGVQHRHQARADKILVCSSSPSSSVTNASLFSRPAFPDLTRHRANTHTVRFVDTINLLALA